MKWRYNMKKVIGIILVVFLAFLWLNDYTPNEGIGEIKEGVEEASSLIKNSSKTAFPSEKSKESISRKAELIIEFLDKN